MDANKLIELKRVGYTLAKCCSNCNQGLFIYPAEFGTCDRFQYQHLKHGNMRHMSIHKFGVCPEHEMKQLAGQDQEFFKHLE